MDTPSTLGDLTWTPVRDSLDDEGLVAAPVSAALRHWVHLDEVRVTAIDPELADTAELCRAHGVAESASVNCVLVAGKRSGEERVAACLVPATHFADVNRAVKQELDVRKASFLPMDRAVAESGMEYGGITPIGLPAEWRLFVEAIALEADQVVIGSGVRGSKLALPGRLLADLPGAEVGDFVQRPG